MSFFIYITILILYLNSNKINSFVVLPFNTIFIKDKTIFQTNYFSDLTQTELYVNFTIGSNNETIKSVIKMDKSGFIIYEKAYNYTNSSTYEKFDTSIDIRWIPKSIRFPSRDNMYLPQYLSYKDFRKMKKYEGNITNKTNFLRVEDIFDDNRYYFNDMFYEYGIIGLKILSSTYLSELDFIRALKLSNYTNSYSFHLYFENSTKNGFATNDNKGYFLIGEKLTDNKTEIDKIEYINCVSLKYRRLAWGMYLAHVYSRYSDDYIEEITNITNSSEIIATFPYIKGVRGYFDYINRIFFDELLEQNICRNITFYRHDLYSNYTSFGYACDSNSPLFMDNLNTKFPDLIFYNRDINRNFILTKKDLFAYNTNDNSDNNLYFLIVDGIDDEERWIFGIPFLKKYVISYDFDNKKIGYYENYGKINDDEPDESDESDKSDKSDEPDKSDDKQKEDKNFFKSLAFKIIMIVIGVIIVFVLGMIFQKFLKRNRKKRANELTDDYDYEAHNAKNENEENEPAINEDKNSGIERNTSQ